MTDVTDLLSDPPSPLDAAIGLVAVELLEDAVVLRLDPPAAALGGDEPRPFLHGGTLATCVDTAGWYALEHASPGSWIAVDLRCDFLGSRRRCRIASSAAASPRGARSARPTSRSPPGTSPTASSPSVARGTCGAPIHRRLGKAPPSRQTRGTPAKRRDVVDELGKNFWWKTVGLVIGLGILGLISMLIFTGLIARFGAIAALIIIFGILMLIAYRSDKKKQRE